MWTPEQLAQHTNAAKKLTQIKQDVALFIKEHPHTNEFEVQQVILEFFKIHGLVLDTHAPIIAFGTNTSHIHYFVEKKTAKKLKPNTLILLDIWAREKESKAPYADMTWMFFYGDEPDPAFVEGFHYIAVARDKAISFIKKNIKHNRFPIGREVDAVSRDYLTQQQLGPYFRHTLGHALGTVSPHAVYSGLSPRSNTVIRPFLGYTIEPGVYFPKKYGFRSEINFYINKEQKVVVTTPVQKELETIPMI